MQRRSRSDALLSLQQEQRPSGAWFDADAETSSASSSIFDNSDSDDGGGGDDISGDGSSDDSLFACDDDAGAPLAAGLCSCCRLKRAAGAPARPPVPTRPLPPTPVRVASYIVRLPDVGTARNSRRAGILDAARVPVALHVANVEASSAGGDRKPPKGLNTWKRFWKYVMRGTTHVWPERCQISDADGVHGRSSNRARVGGHMYIEEVAGYEWNFILPICAAHNNRKRSDCALNNCALNAYTLAGEQFTAYLALRPDAVFAAVNQKASVTAFQQAALARQARPAVRARRRPASAPAAD